MVPTECWGFSEREGGQGSNENKSTGKTLFDVFFFKLINIDSFKPKFHKQLNMIKSANMYICAPSSALRTVERSQ